MSDGPGSRALTLTPREQSSLPYVPGPCPNTTQGPAPFNYLIELYQPVAEASERAIPVVINILDLQHLKALSQEHEVSSRKAARDNALLKKQSAERHFQITRERDAEA